MKTIDRSRLKMLLGREEKRYVAEHPKSRALYERAKGSLLGGVPVQRHHWYVGDFPLFVKEGKGAYFTDVDGHHYLDLWMGDFGDLWGHSPTVVADAIADQAHRGICFALPTEDSVWVGEELVRRFGLPYWQVYMSATDANIAAIKMARHITKRNLILVFKGCYHGTIDETMVSLNKDGIMVPIPFGGITEVVGPLPYPESRTRMIEFNDIDALEKALSPQDIACVITEPVITNFAKGEPDPDYHKALREMTHRFGTLLIIDETQTICDGPGGVTRAWNLEPDIFTMGKAIAGGFPVAIMGVSQKVADSLPLLTERGRFVLGIGTTLTGNALAIAALRANLEHVMTESAYERMFSVTERLANGIDKIIKATDLPWHVNHFGNKVYYYFQPTLAEKAPASDEDLNNFIHLFLINRGILLGPLTCWAIVSAETTIEDADSHNQVFSECVNELVE